VQTRASKHLIPAMRSKLTDPCCALRLAALGLIEHRNHEADLARPLMISTRDLGSLPRIAPLWRLTHSLAMLDAISLAGVGDERF